VNPDGGIDGRLPNLHVPRGKVGGEVVEDGDEELLPAHMIPGWVDKTIGADMGAFDGYRDEAARDESHAWVSLLEGKVHAALILSQPQPSFLTSLLTQDTPTSHGRPLSTLLSPPPAPFSGISSLFPPDGTRISITSIELQYKEAIASLSERLGTDKWFLGSENPTALDALSFAYLHTILHTPDPNSIRIEVTRRVNLVAWERGVRTQVAAAFQRRA
jgi:metaxin